MLSRRRDQCYRNFGARRNNLHMPPQVASSSATCYRHTTLVATPTLLTGKWWLRPTTCLAWRHGNRHIKVGKARSTKKKKSRTHPAKDVTWTVRDAITHAKQLASGACVCVQTLCNEQRRVLGLRTFKWRSTFFRKERHFPSNQSNFFNHTTDFH